MTASSRPPSSSAGKGLVVVCCAGEDAESLRGDLTSLEQEGHTVTLVAGLDDNPKQLVDVIDQHGGEGLYVLCRSPKLDREVVEALREILLAQHVPFARTLTVAVGRAGSLVDRIRAGLRRATTRSADAPAPARRSAAPAIDDEPTLVGVRSEDLVPIEDDEAEQEDDTAAKPPPAPPSSVATLISTTDDSGVGAGPVQRIDSAQLIPDPSGAMRAMSALDFSDLDSLGEAPDITEVGSPPPHITGDTVIGPMPAMITGSTLVGQQLPARVREAAERAFRASASPLPRRAAPSPAAAEPDLDPATTPFTPISAAALQKAARPHPTAPAPPIVSPSASASAARPVGSASISGAPVAAISTVGAAVSMSAAPAHASHPGMPITGADVPPPRQVLPWVLGVVALGLLGLVISLAVRGGDDDADALASKSGEGAEASETKAPETADDGPESGVDDDEPPPPPPLYPVVVALQSRKVRALDVLLIASDPSAPGDYTAADAYCEQLEIEGMDDWRLPLVGELNSLSAAQMIGRGTYWSSTAADTFGDSHMAWNAKRGHALPYDKDAIAVCVRGPTSGT